MRELRRYELDFNLTIDYVKKTIEEANQLSDLLISSLSFKDGAFFTLFPADINVEKIHEFSWGGILPQNPIHQFVGHSWSETPSLINEFAEFISDILIRNLNLHCIIDDVVRYSTDSFVDKEQLQQCIKFSGRDVYYLINHDNLSIPLLVKCLQNSLSFWHSLCVISKYSMGNCLDQQIQYSKLKEFCLCAECFIVGAYDGEGYVLWEKRNGPGCF